MNQFVRLQTMTGLTVVCVLSIYANAVGLDWKYKSGEGLKELEKRNWQQAVNALTEANDGLRAEMKSHGSADSLAAKKLLQYLGAAHLKLAQDCLGTQRLLAADSHAAIAVEIFQSIPWIPKGDLSLAYSTYGLAKDSLSEFNESLELHRKSLMFIEERAGEYDPIRALYSLRAAESYVSLERIYEAEPLYMSVCEITDSVFAGDGRTLGEQRFAETLIPPTKKPPKFKDWLREVRVSSQVGLSRVLRAMERTTEADSMLMSSISEMLIWKKAYCITSMDQELTKLAVESKPNSSLEENPVTLERWKALRLKSEPTGSQK